MWQASAGVKINVDLSNKDDDWETDPDFVNDITEEEQRWGSKTIEGSGRTGGCIDMARLRQETEQADSRVKHDHGPKSSYGYGGKFGIESDRMDGSAVGHEYVENVSKHSSQTDASAGFGGKFGVQKDRQDKSAAGWDHVEKVEKHQSQTDHSAGFGGKYGVQKDRQDKSAAGWDHVEKVAKHQSQTDHSTGFGGKFGVQKDRQDKSAAGWDHVEKVEKHQSQTDHSTGFGGKFGVQKDRQDKSAAGWDHVEKVEKHQSQTDYAKGFGGKFGVESERQDQCAVGFDDSVDRAATNPVSAQHEIQANVGSASQMRNRFEQLVTVNDRDPVVHHSTAATSGARVTPSVAATQEANHERDSQKEEEQDDVIPQQYQPVTASDTDTVQPDTATVDSSGHTARALFDYQAADVDELTFDPDEIIKNIEMIDEGWWRGECRGTVGLFPANFVELMQ